MRIFLLPIVPILFATACFTEVTTTEDYDGDNECWETCAYGQLECEDACAPNDSACVDACYDSDCNETCEIEPEAKDVRLYVVANEQRFLTHPIARSLCQMWRVYANSYLEESDLPGTATCIDSDELPTDTPLQQQANTPEIAETVSCTVFKLRYTARARMSVAHCSGGGESYSCLTFSVNVDGYWNPQSEYCS